MKATIKTIKSQYSFVYKRATPITYEIGPKKNEPFYFVEDTAPEYVVAIPTVLRIMTKDDLRIVETRDSTYEIRKVK